MKAIHAEQGDRRPRVEDAVRTGPPCERAIGAYSVKLRRASTDGDHLGAVSTSDVETSPAYSSREEERISEAVVTIVATIDHAQMQPIDRWRGRSSVILVVNVGNCRSEESNGCTRESFAREGLRTLGRAYAHSLLLLLVVKVCEELTRFLDVIRVIKFGLICHILIRATTAAAMESFAAT